MDRSHILACPRVKTDFDPASIEAFYQTHGTNWAKPLRWLRGVRIRRSKDSAQAAKFTQHRAAG